MSDNFESFFNKILSGFNLLGKWQKTIDKGGGVVGSSLMDAYLSHFFLLAKFQAKRLS